MNITELARKLKISTQELRDKLPEIGFSVGEKAIQIDDRVAQKILETWNEYKEKEKIKEIGKKIEKKGEKEGEKEERELETINLPSSITVYKLADRLNLSVVKVISELMKNGIMAKINDRIDYETAAIIAEDLGFKTRKKDEREELKRERVKEILRKKDKKKLSPRPPVVVVMGHVDHGKTMLLDTIRRTNVISSEKGGITQHIGAYQIKKKGRLITFIDTPGHEAFKEMRARGGMVADIAVLVIAADEGIKPQTLESLKIIQEENLALIVAINKIDKEGADIERVKKQLSEINLTPEDWGGKTICVSVSAKTGQGIDDLLEMILLVADLEKDKLLADPNQKALGTVIESYLDKNEGPIAIVLIQNGTLRQRDSFLVGDIRGRVKTLKDFRNQPIDKALPSTPVKIYGLKSVPEVGDILRVSENKKEFKKKTRKKRKKIFEQILSLKEKDKSEEKIKKLNLVLKADVLGSLEAIEEALSKIEPPKGIKINIIKKGLGQITEADVLRAEVDNGLVIGFHTTVSSGANLLAKDKEVRIKIFDVIYHLIDEIKKEINELLEPRITAIETGWIKVLVVFRKEKNFMILGGRVEEGEIFKNTKCLAIREGKEIGLGKLTQLQVAKKDVEKVVSGTECGLKFEGKTILRVGDILRVFKEEKEKKELI